MKMNASIIIPVYNEEKTVSEIIKEIKKTLRKEKNSEIIVVNDASTDNSLKMLKKIKGIKIINHEQNKGYGASIKTGIKAAKGSTVAIIDADGTYPVYEIPRLLTYMRYFDMVVGARTKKAQEPLLRKPAKKILCILTSMLVKKWVPDINSGLRAFNKSLAKRFMKLYPDRFSFTTTITICFLMNKYKVKFLPIEYYKRAGKSQIKPMDFFKFIILIIKIFNITRKSKLEQIK